MFLLDDTPNTVNYMLAGYTVLVGFPILYIVSWLIRRSGLKREMDLLKAMEAEKDAAAARSGGKVGKNQA